MYFKSLPNLLKANATLLIPDILYMYAFTLRYIVIYALFSQTMYTFALRYDLTHFGQ